MKKIIILLISLTLIVSCLVIGASAKLFTPPTEADYCIIIKDQTIAYPYYTIEDVSISVGSECLYPTILDVYDTDSFSGVYGSYNENTDSYPQFIVTRSGNNITVKYHDGKSGIFKPVYTGVGYDVLFYYLRADDGDLYDSSYAIVDSDYNFLEINKFSDNLSLNSYKVTVAEAESNGKTIGYGVAYEPPETEAPETETPVVPPVTPSDPAEGGHITEVITDGIIPFVGGLGSAFVMAFTSLFIYEGNINVLGIFILTMFGIALGYGVIRWITHLFRKE